MPIEGGRGSERRAVAWGRGVVGGPVAVAQRTRDLPLRGSGHSLARSPPPCFAAAWDGRPHSVLQRPCPPAGDPAVTAPPAPPPFRIAPRPPNRPLLPQSHNVPQNLPGQPHTLLPNPASHHGPAISPHSPRRLLSPARTPPVTLPLHAALPPAPGPQTPPQPPPPSCPAGCHDITSHRHFTARPLTPQTQLGLPGGWVFDRDA